MRTKLDKALCGSRGSDHLPQMVSLNAFGAEDNFEIMSVRSLELAF